MLRALNPAITSYLSKRAKRSVSAGEGEEHVRQASGWITNEAMWRVAVRAFQAYANRRRKQRPGEPRRLLADLLICARS